MSITTLDITAAICSAVPIFIGISMIVWMCVRVFGIYHRLLNEEEPEEFRLNNFSRPPRMSTPQSINNEGTFNGDLLG